MSSPSIIVILYSDIQFQTFDLKLSLTITQFNIMDELRVLHGVLGTTLSGTKRTINELTTYKFANKKNIVLYIMWLYFDFVQLTNN